MAEGERWYRTPHVSCWLALASVFAGTLAVSACVFPFPYPDTAARHYSGVPLAAVQWLTYIVSAVSVPAVVAVSLAIRRHGLHVVVYAAASSLLLGAILRCFSLIPAVNAADDTRSVLSFAIVYAGTAVMALALGPFQVAGALVSTTFPSEGRLLVHGMVCAATPLGMVLGTIVPRLAGVVPGATKARNMDALLLFYAALAGVAFIITVHLMRTATQSLQAPSGAGKADRAAASASAAGETVTATESGVPPTELAPYESDSESEGEALPRRYSATDNTAAATSATDFLPQLAKLARTAEYLCFAAAFAACVAPFYLLFGAQDLLLPVACGPMAGSRAGSDSGFWGSPSSAAILSATVLLLMLIPCVLHFAFLRRRVRPVSILLPGIALLALIVVWANLVSESGGVPATGTTSHALLAAMALFATALMPLLLESSISAAERDRPALAAGAVWLATHLLVVVFAGALHGLRVSDAACPAPLALMADDGGTDAAGGLIVAEAALTVARGRTLDRIKWLCVVSIGLASIAAVSSLLISTKIDKSAYFGAGTPDEAPVQSFHSLHMTSNTRDALHPDNLPQSFVRPVWWQNPTAEMRHGLKEALEELQAEARNGAVATGGAQRRDPVPIRASRDAAQKAPEAVAARVGPGGVPRPVRVDLRGSDQRRGIGSSSSLGDGAETVAAAPRGAPRRSRKQRQHSRAVARQSSIWGSRNSSWDSHSERFSTRGSPRARSVHSTATSGMLAGGGSNI